MNPLSAEELRRYARHLALPEFGRQGQEKARQARVLVVGAGGLGSPMLLYLAAAGIGRIGIVDFDRVDETNLQRQVLYTMEDIGKPKAVVAREKLLALNPHIEVEVFEQQLTSENALGIISRYDIVADGTDNFPTRYLVNDACVLAGKVNVYASIFRFEGQVSVFNYPQEDGIRGPNYRDLFPAPPPAELVPNCAEGGVLGVLPGIIGSMQASEVIKVATGVGEPLSGKLFLFDAASFTSRILKIRKNPDLVIERLIDYEQFCAPQPKAPVPQVSVRDLRQMMEEGADFQLIDVREPYEYEIANLGGALIPPDQVKNHVHRISKDKKVVFHCRSGKRSADAIRELQKLAQFDNLYNLEGGILAWAREIDPEMRQY
ncbi:MAG: molybdopterin-synthase adenylyltransferase MoeB [Lewinellaceae bacterium]|nr:molybdopterin-synthase adenylyltransferase MoeB [Lewinellaceae bacterium]